MIVDSLLNKIVDLLETDITHIGLGTGGVSQTDTVLENELLRLPCIGFKDGNTLIVEIDLDEHTGNDITYTNIGAFGGGATDDIGTGTLLAAGLINITKTRTQSLTTVIELTVERT